MAADRGLLEFDGYTWKSYKGDKGITRSLLVMDNSLIYTGSDLDFGVWVKDDYFHWNYQSLYPFKDDLAEFSEEFWGVYSLDDKIVFVSFHNIYIYQKGMLTKIPVPFRLSGSFYVEGEIFLQDEKEGLFLFNGLTLKKVIDKPKLDDYYIVGIYKNHNDHIIVTRNAGLFSIQDGALKKINLPISDIVFQGSVFSFERIDTSMLAFGTISYGLLISDIDGNIIHQINRVKGLPNNTILSLHNSYSGDLWMGLDYGISVLDILGEVTYFHDYRGDFGTGYTALLKDNIFYLGTNQGLFISDWDALNNNRPYFNFQLIKGSEGQVWDIVALDENILIGHNQGLFLLKDLQLVNIHQAQGVWNIVPFRDYILAGNYNGISIYQRERSTWKFIKKMELIYGSCNQIVVENDDNIWINIPNFGIIKANVNRELYPLERTIFTDDTFEGNNLILGKDDWGIYAYTENKTYRFQNDQFIESDQLYDNKSIYGAVLTNVHPIHLDSDYIFFPVNNGFALKSLRQQRTISNKKYSIVIRRLETFNNRISESFRIGDKLHPSLNNILVEVVVPGKKEAQFQFQLNKDQGWSPLTHSNTFQLFNLSAGKHLVKIRGILGNEIIEENELWFTIGTPWYRNEVALVVYIFLMIFIIILIRNGYKKRFESQKSLIIREEQEKLKIKSALHQQEIEKMEQIQMQKNFEILKQQLRSKTLELAVKAKENRDKNRILLTLQEKLEEGRKEPSIAKRKIEEAFRILDGNLSEEDKLFEIQMDELHQEFYKKLKEKYSILSINDLRLCVYMKIGLSSKEIAELLNVLPSSIYISRSRLRKKLGLLTDDNLHDFLNTL